MGCAGSLGLGFMMPGMAFCMSSIISVLYNPDPAVMQKEVGCTSPVMHMIYHHRQCHSMCLQDLCPTGLLWMSRAAKPQNVLQLICVAWCIRLEPLATNIVLEGLSL